MFHGLVLPFLFERCNQLNVKNITVDWDIPFVFQGEVVAVNEKEGWRELKPATEGFSWTLENGRIQFPNIDGFAYSELGSTLSFDGKEKRVTHGAWDIIV